MNEPRVWRNSELGIYDRHDRHEYHVICVDTSVVHYKGKKWEDLGDWERRKFENLIFLQYPQFRIKVLYNDLGND